MTRFNAPPTSRPETHYIVCYKKYAVSNKNVLGRRLKVVVHLVFLSSRGSLFHARGAETANALSLSFSLVLGMT